MSSWFFQEVVDDKENKCGSGQREKSYFKFFQNKILKYFKNME